MPPCSDCISSVHALKIGKNCIEALFEYGWAPGRAHGRTGARAHDQSTEIPVHWLTASLDHWSTGPTGPTGPTEPSGPTRDTGTALATRPLRH